MLAGLEIRPVNVEADIARGGAGTFSLVGLAATTVKEARERVRSAIRNSGLEFPQTRLTVNLAPAELRKEGTALDLPMAVAIALARAGKSSPPRSAFLGELALDGSVRQDVEAQLKRLLAEVHTLNNPAGTWFMSVASTLFFAAFFGLIGLVLLRIWHLPR